MKKVAVWEFLTVDGIMESPEHWQFPYVSERRAKGNREKE
jgi:hypothetical protein